MLTQKVKAYAEYYNLSSNNEVLSCKNSNKKWINERKLDTKLIASLIKREIATNKITEFSDTFYVEEGLIYPTISESFAKENNEAVLLTPYVDSQVKENVSIYKVDKNNPYGPYSNFNQDKIYHLIKTSCFVTEKNLPRLSDNFKLWAKNGIACVYAISGKTSDHLVKKDKEAKEFINYVISNEPLKVNVSGLYDKKSKSFAKIYVIRKNR